MSNWNDVEYRKKQAEWLKERSRILDVIKDHFPILDSLIYEAFEIEPKEEITSLYSCCYTAARNLEDCPIHNKTKPEIKEQKPRPVYHYKECLFITNGVDELIKLNPPEKPSIELPEKIVEKQYYYYTEIVNKINEIIEYLAKKEGE